MSLFFFFQAEDGIRDLTVTGVQTCALPILGCGPQTGKRGASDMTQQHGDRLTAVDASFVAQEGPTSHMHVGAVMIFDGPAAAYDDLADHVRRSEERRVGKECRSRWSRRQ